MDIPESFQSKMYTPVYEYIYFGVEDCEFDVQKSRNSLTYILFEDFREKLKKSILSKPRHVYTQNIENRATNSTVTMRNQMYARCASPPRTQRTSL